MWYPVLDEERGMVMNKSQPDLVEVVAEGGCLLLLEFETGELRRLDVSSFLKRGGSSFGSSTAGWRLDGRTARKCIRRPCSR